MDAGIAELKTMKLTKAAELLKENGHETLTDYGFSDSHWVKLRTNISVPTELSPEVRR
ncbi:MAG: hypothetical protein NXH97_12285 [Rhodobacteraceae bacterium]|nr:hypothetical protein [Paracoccaceae bacterium]